VSSMEGKEKKKEKDEDFEVPDCFGSFGLTDDCVGCPFETECQTETEEIMEEEGECD